MKKASIATFGCKLNQYESQLMAEQIKDEYEIVNFKDGCDLYIVNSCAVTSKASKESRNLAKRILKTNPQSTVVYTGCDSYLENLSGITIVGNSYKNNIKKALQKNFSDTSQETKTYPINILIKDFEKKSRAFIKIQEGCNNHCTYCIIPKLRGKERDKDMGLVLNEIQSLSKFPEIVLSGTNIGSYKNLKELLKKIDALNLKTRIRISSIEPMYIDNEFIDIIADGRFAKHLHIPLQSGCDRILKLMGRDYNRNFFERIAKRCYDKGIFIGTDVIVGFFGETEKEFLETYRFIEDLPLVFGHVFSYSKRPYTAANNIKMKLEKGPIVKERNAQLKELFLRKFRQAVETMVKKETEIIVESTTIKRNNQMYYKAISSQYFPVLVKEQLNGLVNVVINDFDGVYAYA